MQNRIKQVRTDNELTQKAYGEKLNLSENYVMMLEKGMRNPSTKTIAQICKVFGVNEEWLTTGKGKPYIPRTIADDVAEIAENLLKDQTPDKRERLKKLICEALDAKTEADIALMWELAKRNGYLK